MSFLETSSCRSLDVSRELSLAWPLRLRAWSQSLGLLSVCSGLGVSVTSGGTGLRGPLSGRRPPRLRRRLWLPLLALPLGPSDTRGRGGGRGYVPYGSSPLSPSSESWGRETSPHCAGRARRNAAAPSTSASGTCAPPPPRRFGVLPLQHRGAQTASQRSLVPFTGETAALRTGPRCLLRWPLGFRQDRDSKYLIVHPATHIK